MSLAQYFSLAALVLVAPYTTGRVACSLAALNLLFAALAHFKP